jgi:hypothetical protein
MKSELPGAPEEQRRELRGSNEEASKDVAPLGAVAGTSKVPEVLYVTFGDYCRIAAEVLGTTPEQVARLPRIPLADSALASPNAGFGDQDAHPTLIEQVAVLVEHLARSHPLPRRQQALRILGRRTLLGS